MTRKPSDEAGAGGGARSAEHAPESEAVEAAKRIVAVAERFPSNWRSQLHESDIEAVAHAFLSLSSRVETAREEMKEECAKVAEADHTPAYGPHKDAMEHLADTQRRNIAERIRSLSVK